MLSVLSCINQLLCQEHPVKIYADVYYCILWRLIFDSSFPFFYFQSYDKGITKFHKPGGEINTTGKVSNCFLIVLSEAYTIIDIVGLSIWTNVLELTLKMATEYIPKSTQCATLMVISFGSVCMYFIDATM